MIGTGLSPFSVCDGEFIPFGGDGILTFIVFCSVFQLVNIYRNEKANNRLNCIFNDLTPSKLVYFRKACTAVRNTGVLKGLI